MFLEFSDKNADIARLAETVLQDPSLLSQIVAGLRLKVNTKSPEETIRYNCFKVLMHLVDGRGDLLYPEWDNFVQQLGSANSYHKMASVQLIAALVKTDVEHKFEGIFDAYFDLLDDQSVIVAIYVASNAGKIVGARPDLEPRITDKLVGIENTHHLPGRKALVAAGAIEAFGQYVGQVPDRKRINEFVREYEHSDSPKTRKLSREFLKKWAT